MLRSFGIDLTLASLLWDLHFIIGSGVVLLMANYIGRGQKEETNRAFNMIFFIQLSVSIIITITVLIFARPLVVLFGARGFEVVDLAVLYLRSYSLCIILGPLNMTLCLVLRLYGYQKEAVLSLVLEFLANVFFSLLLLFTTELGFLAFGIGTSVSMICSFVYVVISMKRKKLSLSIRWYWYTFSEVRHVVVSGFPASSDDLAESIVSGIINNIIVFFIGTTALPIYTIVKNITNLFIWSTDGVTQSVQSLYVILFGQRDRNGMVRVGKASLVYGLLFSFCLTSLVLAMLPFLITFFGGGDESTLDVATITQGVWCIAVIVPLLFLEFSLTRIQMATGRNRRAFVFSVVPDSLIQPLLMCVLIRPFGYWGIWWSYGFGVVLFLLGYYIWQSVRKKHWRWTIDDFFDFEDDILENVPRLDLSIQNTDKDIVGLSALIDSFLIREGISKRNAFMSALCLEELAVDMKVHCTAPGIVDVHMFVKDKEVRVMIRNADRPYNPLDFVFNTEDNNKIGVFMAQKVARKISYEYIYKMNMVSIIIRDEA